MHLRKPAVFFTLFMLTAYLHAVSPGNMIANGDFEQKVTEWETLPWKNPKKAWLVPVQDNSQSQGAGGMKSLRMDWTSDQICHLIYNKPLVFNEKDRTLYLSFWCRSAGYENYTRGQFGLAMEFPEIKGQKGDRLTLLTPWDRLLPDWTFFEKKIQLPEKVTKGKLIMFIHGYKNKKGTSWVDNIYLGPESQKTAMASGPALELLRGVPKCDHGGIYYPGETMTYTVEIGRNQFPGREVDFNWRAEDFDRRLIRKGKLRIKLPPAGGSFPLTLPSFGEFRGWFALKGSVKDQNIAADMLSAGIVVEKQKGKRDPFFTGKIVKTPEKKIRMGMGSLWVCIRREYVQPQEDKYDWRYVQKRFDICRKYGLEPYCDVQIGQYMKKGRGVLQPPFLSKKINDRIKRGEMPYDQEYYEGWRKFLQTVIQRYGKEVQDWYVSDEIYNIYRNFKYELPHFIQVTKILSEEVKKADPTDKVAGCGAFMDKDPIGAKIWKELSPWLDGLSCSLYLGNSTVDKGLTLDGPESGKLEERFRHTRSIIGKDKFISGTESGYCILNFPPIDSDSVKEVAIINARNLVILKALGVRKWNFFTIDNDNSYESKARGSGRVDYGMWSKKTAAPKPHAASWAVSARVLAFVTDPMKVEIRPDIYCYLFRKDNRTLAAVWAHTKTPFNSRVTMPADWQGMDFLGRRYNGAAGDYKFKLDDRVQYFTFDASQKAVAEAFRGGHYMTPEAYVTMNRLNAGSMGVYIVNKLGRDYEAEVRLTGCPSRKVTVGKNGPCLVTFACPAGDKTLTAEVIVHGVSYKATKLDEWYPVSRLSASPSLKDGRLLGFAGTAPIVMDSRDFLMPKHVDGHSFWTGPEDLSAKIYLGYDDRNFYLGADVTDDVHISRYSGMYSWNQDSIQFAFDTGNNAFDELLTPGGYAPDDRDMVVADTPDGPELYCHAGPDQITHRKLPAQTVRRQDNHTLYLVSLPWSYLGRLRPVPGSVFGFNFLIFDQDTPTGTVFYQMEFAPGITFGKKPFYFKRFILK